MVLGVSPDSVASHARFRERHRLGFTLVADEDQRIARAYGVWKDRSVLGVSLGSVQRSTFIIDEEGVVQHAWRKVGVQGHAARVRKALGG